MSLSTRRTRTRGRADLAPTAAGAANWIDREDAEWCRLGYMPIRAAFDERGYEVRKVPGDSFTAMDTGEQIRESSLELLRKLHGISEGRKFHI